MHLIDEHISDVLQSAGALLGSQDRSIARLAKPSGQSLPAVEPETISERTIVVITADQIKHLRRGSVDYDETQVLLARFAGIRATRQPLFLTAEDFDAILRWKLGTQYGRQQQRRLANTKEVIRAVTGVALTISHPDPDYKLELRVGLLCTLRGVAVPVASAILALVHPKDYGVIDFRVWRQVFGTEASTFSVPDYKRYMREIRRLAQELNWTAQEVDLVIWDYDRRAQP